MVQLVIVSPCLVRLLEYEIQFENLTMIDIRCASTKGSRSSQLQEGKSGKLAISIFTISIYLRAIFFHCRAENFLDYAGEIAFFCKWILGLLDSQIQIVSGSNIP